MAAGDIKVQFTPDSAIVGGLTLGVATLGKYVLTGRVLGISGTTRGLVMGDMSAWRLAFITGMAIGGILATQLVPNAFEKLPPSFTVSSECYIAMCS